MQTISYSRLRQNLADTLDQVNEDHAPILITRQNGKEAVLISYEDYRSIEETLYLLSNPANAERLLKSIAELEAGKGKKRNVIE
jgi:antitoxin YefM